MSGYPEHSVNDLRVVAWTADLLDISEYDVFEAAYRDWYHEPPASGLIDGHFGRYMYEGIAPFWVRAFARRTVETARIAVAGSQWPGAATLALIGDLLRLPRRSRKGDALLRA